jgi:DNA-binding NarL/FixJ family response regulator
MTTRQAAARLGVTEKTLENHTQGAYGRLGANNRMAAIRVLAGYGSPAFALGEIPH